MRNLRCLFVMLFFGILLTACVPASGGVVLPTAAPTVVVSEALRQDAEMMAKDLGISVEEAVQRSSLQDLVGQLNAALAQNEVKTFAGLWIQHEPEYRIVTAFTQNGDETIRPYVEDTPLAEWIEVRTAPKSLAELQAIQQSVIQIVHELNFPFSSSLNVQKNQIELYVTDQALWESALQEAGLQLPEPVEVIVIYEPLGDEMPIPITPVAGLAFPQLRVQSSSFMAALLEGELIAEANCLRVRMNAGNESHLIIWQPDYFLNDHDGTIEVLNRAGQVVAMVGKTIRTGGGEVHMTPELEGQLREPIPEACGGPFWLMGEIVLEK